MSIDRTTVAAQKRELERYADDLAEIHTKLLRYKNSLNAAWSCVEKEMLNDAIMHLNRQINRLKEETDSIGVDLVKAADEIAEEEKAVQKETEEKAEREKAEKEEVAKEKVAREKIAKKKTTKEKVKKRKMHSRK